MNAIEKMKEDELIWTRRNNIYYICRILNNNKYHLPKNKKQFDKYCKKIGKYFLNFEEACKNDIWHFVECDYYEVGTEEDILGCIVNSFKAGGVTQRITRGYDSLKYFSMKKYNEYNNYYKKIPEIKDKWESLWEGLLDVELEELVGLYLQVDMGYGVYTSTNKKDTKQYEFVLFKKETGERAYIQVKANNINLSLYKDLTKYGKVFIYSNNDKEYETIDNIIVITKKELQSFISNNKNILPNKVRLLLNLK